MPTGAGQATEQNAVDFLMASDKLSQELRSDEDQELVKQVWTMLLNGKKYRANWDRHWEKWWMLWESQHWQRPRYSISQSTVNLVHRAVETFVGNITDNLPQPDPKPTHPDFTESAQIARQQLLYIWRRNQGNVTVRRPIRSALVCGTGWLRVDWDETELRGKGDVVFTPRDARSIWVSPHAESPWLKDALYVIEARNVPREYVVRSFPDRGMLVPPGVWDGSLGSIRAFIGGASQWDDSGLAYFKTTDGSKTQGSFGTNNASEKQGLVTLVEAWIRQDDGSLRYVVVSNGVVLQDGLSPYDDDEYPYVPFYGIRTDDGFYPRGLVQFIENLQYEMNELHSYAMDIIHFSADPILTMDEENLEMGAKIDNVPGAVLPKIRGSEIGYLQSPGMKPEIIQLQEQVKSYFDEVLGNIDILSGIRPTGVNTLGGLEVLRDQANVRLRMMVEDMRQSLRILYLRCLARFRQFVKDERTFRVPGTGNTTEEFITVNKINGFQATGEPIRENVIPEDADFEMDLDTAPGGPAGRQAKKDESLTLHGAGVIDQEAVLKDFEREDKEEILQRMQEQMAAMAQAEAQAAQGTQGGTAVAAPVPASAPAAQPGQSPNTLKDAYSAISELMSSS